MGEKKHFLDFFVVVHKKLVYTYILSVFLLSKGSFKGHLLALFSARFVSLRLGL